MATDTLQIIIKSRAEGQGSEQARSGLAKLEKAAKFAAGAFAAMKAAQAAVDFVKLGASAERQAQALDNLARAAGSSGDAITEAIQGASDFTIDRMTAMSAANKAMLLDVAKSPEEFERLTTTAVALGRAMGQDAAKSIDDFVVAAGRQSKQIADNLGLIVDAGSAYEVYAAKLGKTADALTDAEKKQAFLNAMLESGEEKLLALGASEEDAAAKIEKLGAAWSDAKVGLAEMAVGFLDSVINVDKFAEGLRTIPETLSKIGMLAAGVDDAAKALFAGEDAGAAFNRGVRMAYFASEDYLESIQEAPQAVDGWSSALDDNEDAVIRVQQGTEDLQTGLDEVADAFDGAGMAAEDEHWALEQSSQAHVDHYRQVQADKKAMEEAARAAEELAERQGDLFTEALGVSDAVADLDDQLDGFNEKLLDLNSDLEDGTGNWESTSTAIAETEAEIEKLQMDKLALDLYNAADAAGADALELAGLAGALGLYTDEQLEAALAAAAMQVALQDLGQKIADGMDFSEALAELDELKERILGIPSERTIQMRVLLDDRAAAGYVPPGVIPNATGGDWLVNRPTLFLAGEAGPERATFTPLAGPQHNDNSRNYNFYGPVGGNRQQLGSLLDDVGASLAGAM